MLALLLLLLSQGLTHKARRQEMDSDYTYQFLQSTHALDTMNIGWGEVMPT